MPPAGEYHQRSREKFGSRSEKLSPEQFNLPLEDIEIAQGVLDTAQEKAKPSSAASHLARRATGFSEDTGFSVPHHGRACSLRATRRVLPICLAQLHDASLLRFRGDGDRKRDREQL
ncbi:hypothetical protein [Chelativorans alearense]|uniref:IS66 family transposase n=1 Tax=Chelativorans alearense TaxID=2681495 RepID=UPI0013D1291A|nr:hypothetical protein [Chelativorans alearense]